MNITDKISRTGRVQSWIDNPDGRLPVSCTVYSVSDSMEGFDGIEDSWRFVSHALRYGAGCAVHLSNLRPAGHENGKGLIASGPMSFAKFYNLLNQELRRGGTYRNGAVTLHMDIDHQDIRMFVNTTRAQLPWVKKCVNLTQELWDKSNQDTKEDIIAGIQRGDVWLNKMKWDKNGSRILGNVCLEVYLPSRGTCLLQHVNLGACTVNEIPEAFVAGMRELCDLHAKTGVQEHSEYLPPTIDKQVGLGMLGLANLLKLEGVSYAEFGEALFVFNNGVEISNNHPASFEMAMKIVQALHMGIERAAAVARSHYMQRAFAIAPTASCSYRSVDREGNTCTPEIAPPIARSIDRDSDTFGVKTYEYGDVEIASKVGFDVYQTVANEIVRMLENTGLFHGYSFNTWSDVVTYDEDFIQDWLESPQTSMYYSLQVMGDVQDKSSTYAALDADEVMDYLENILNEPSCDCQE